MNDKKNYTDSMIITERPAGPRSSEPNHRETAAKTTRPAGGRVQPGHNPGVKPTGVSPAANTDARRDPRLYTEGRGTDTRSALTEAYRSLVERLGNTMGVSQTGAPSEEYVKNIADKAVQIVESAIKIEDLEKLRDKLQKEVDALDTSKERMMEERNRLKKDRKELEEYRTMLNEKADEITKGFVEVTDTVDKHYGNIGDMVRKHGTELSDSVAKALETTKDEAARTMEAALGNTTKMLIDIQTGISQIQADITNALFNYSASINQTVEAQGDAVSSAVSRGNTSLILDITEDLNGLHKITEREYSNIASCLGALSRTIVRIEEILADSGSDPESLRKNIETISSNLRGFRNIFLMGLETIGLREVCPNIGDAAEGTYRLRSGDIAPKGSIITEVICGGVEIVKKADGNDNSRPTMAAPAIVVVKGQPE